jgi:probable F420-dependent oxidoreductase
MREELDKAAEQVRERIGRVGVWLTTIGRAPAAEERESVAAIEELGYGALWVGEARVSKEIFSHAALLLAASPRLTIGSGIANIYVRDATAMNAGANALAEAYPGRFVLGIGVSHRPLVAPRGHDYGRPVATMRAYLDAMDDAGYAPPLPSPPVPRVLAALRPRMLELARERAVGAHPYFVPPEHTARARETLGAGPLLAPEQAVVLETDPERARARAREHMASYLRLPNYTNNLRTLGYEDGDFADGGSDRLVDAIVAWGDAGAIRARVQDHLDAGADHVAIQPLAADIGGAMAQLRALAPALLAG